MYRIVLVDDEPALRLAVGDLLESEGYDVTVLSDGQEALEYLQEHPVDMVITDIRMPRLDGRSLFRRIKKLQPKVDVIIMTAYGEVADAVESMREGALDYLTKPFDDGEILMRVARAAERLALQRELDQARASLRKAGASATIIGQSAPMVKLQKRLEAVARSEAAVVIYGESGTGKELVARSIHQRSSRVDQPFVAVHCAAFPETLIEAELFGHEKGAFTGAAKRRDGRFKAADGGVLFLDEVGEIPPLVQAKLLRVLQEGAVEPLGANDLVPVDVRVVCATHRDLKKMIAAGEFREDLYYRLNVLDLHVPPLRDRRGDLPLLVEFFLDKYRAAELPRPALAPAAWGALSEYTYPGNVRELEHAMHHAVALLGDDEEVDLEHLPRDIVGVVDDEGTPRSGVRPLQVAMREFERMVLLRALHEAEGKRTKAAKMLEISRKNLWEKLKAHGVTDSDLVD